MARKDKKPAKKSGGFLDGLFHSLSLQGAIELSKDKNGKPDPYKAAGIAAAQGHTSLGDTLRLGEMLIRQGAFDKDDSFSQYTWRDECDDDYEHGIFTDNYDTRAEFEEALEEARHGWRRDCTSDYLLGILTEDYETQEEFENALHEAKYGWRDECEADYIHGICPEDYETREEFETALNEARSAWRWKRIDGLEYGIDTRDYQTEDEYLAAVHEAMYGWRDTCESGILYDVDPDDYETEEEYEEALEEAKYGWRDTCEDGSEYGISPYDYETEDEYEEALAEAQGCVYISTSAPASIPLQLRLSVDFAEPENEPESAPRPKREDYATELMWDAACRLYDLQQEYGEDFREQSYIKEDCARCDFILQHQELIAAQYLTPDGDFLYARAVKEHFSLSFALDEKDYKEGECVSLLKDIIREDASLAADVWVWLLKHVYPYRQYLCYSYDLESEIQSTLSSQPDAFVDRLTDQLQSTPEVMPALFVYGYNAARSLPVLLSRTLSRGMNELAADIFRCFVAQEDTSSGNICDALEQSRLSCYDSNAVETLEAFRDVILPIAKELPRERVVRSIKHLEDKIAEDIDYVERNADKYAYSRRYAWRTSCQDGSAWNIKPIWYETEAEYDAAIAEEKYSWRKRYARLAQPTGIDPANFETEDAYKEAVQAAEYKEKYGWREHAEDGSAYGLSPETFEHEWQYQVALNNTKYRWRMQYLNVARMSGIDPKDFETEEEYKTALSDDLKARRERSAQQDSEQDQPEEDFEAPDTHQQYAHYAEQHPDAWRSAFRHPNINLGLDPDAFATQDEFLSALRAKHIERRHQASKPAHQPIYTYCGVRFAEVNKVYHYRCGDCLVEVGDKVEVPIGDDGCTTTGTVVSVGQYKADAVPFPVERTKCILRKL